MQLSGATIPGAELEPLLAERHGSRWLVLYSHPQLARYIALPALVEDGQVVWIGETALPARGAALVAEALPLAPRIEGHRLPTADGDAPVYLVLPKKADVGALVVRVYEGAAGRGADGLDAWLLSRGYGVLQVGFGDSSGSAQAESSEASVGSVVDNMAAAVRWAVEKRKVLGEAVASAGGPPPVAVMGSYFGGSAVLQALHKHPDLFACGVAIAPQQPLPDSWQQSGGGKAPALLLAEFERDGTDGAGDLLEQVAPAGTPPEDWVQTVQLVQYAGEGRGGGTAGQNSRDLYRRIDAFLHASLAPAAVARLRAEAFVDEIPFFSSALVGGSAKAKASEESYFIEQALEESLKQKKNKDVIAGFPDLTELASAKKGKGVSFSEESRVRAALPMPASRVALRPDGTIEVTVVFQEAPEDLHAVLSEVWLHVRAKGTALTVALPRQPKDTEALRAWRLPGGKAFTFEMSGNMNIGALDNYQAWAATSKGEANIFHLLLPKDIEDSPVRIPGEVEVTEDIPEAPQSVVAEVVG